LGPYQQIPETGHDHHHDRSPGRRPRRRGARIEGANIVKTDILASNGIIHVIDRVILPR
jgi:hypothetical protein